MFIKVVKAGSGSRRTSTTYECPHFTVDQRESEWIIEFPQTDDPTITSVAMPDDADVVYHMDMNGDTVDSWSWDPSQELAEHKNHDKSKH